MKPIRKDPAGFKTTELANARILAGLVTDFEELFLRVIERKGVRALATPVKYTFDLAAFYAAIDAIEGFIDKDPANKASVTVTVASVQHGRVWADRNLARFGYSTTAPPQSNAKPYYLPPEQRMVDMYRDAMVSEIKNITGQYATGIKRELQEAWSKGETIDQITRRVRDVTGRSINKSITVARTETLRAGNAAVKERYAAAGIEMVEWVTARDDRQCDECDSLHGTTYPIGEEPDLPVHPNCRCTVVPVIEVK